MALATPSLLLAEDPSDSSSPARRRLIGSVLSNTRAPANVGDTTAPGYDVTLEGTSEEKTGTVSATWASHDGTETYRLKLTGPLNQTTREATPFTQAGLPGSGSAEVTYQHILLDHSRDAEAQTLLCDLVGSEFEACGDDSFVHTSDRRPIIRDLRRKYSLASPASKAAMCRFVGKQQCGTEDLESVDMREAYLVATNVPESLRLWGLTAGASRSTFDYLTAGDLDEQQESHNNWKVAAHVGLYRPSAGYLRLGVTYKDAYQAAGGASEICQAIADAEAVRCREVVVGAPTNATSTIASLEWRYFLPGGKVAISPSVSRDLRNKVDEFVLPIYFLGSEGGLTGGARIGWESEKEAITFAIFVGAALRVVE